MSRLDPALRAVANLLGRAPGGVVRRLAGRTHVNDRGDALDPHVAFLWRLEGVAPGLPADVDPAGARAAMRRAVALVQSRPPVVPTRALTVPGGAGARPARHYIGPDGAPLLLWLHGGGWVAGDLESHDVLCRQLCARGGLQVVALDYRLAPEQPFPAGYDDAIAAMRWAVGPGRLALGAGRVAVGGDSAGGNLTLAAALALRDAGEALPDLLAPLYPAVDLRCLTASHTLFADGPFLTAASIRTYRAAYGAPHDDPRASVALAGSLVGLPPTVLGAAGFDLLRDEGEQFAAALASAGVPVTCLREPHLPHGWANIDGAVPEARAALERFTRAIVDALRS